MKYRDESEIIKICLLGAGGVGKSTIVARLMSGNFIEKTMTVGIDIDTWMILFDDLPPTKICFFDFGGQEQFKFFQSPLMAGAKIALLVFDYNVYRTMLAIEDWISLTSHISDEFKLLIANKIDRQSETDDHEIRRYSEKYNLDYIMVSAKEGTNFDDLENRIRRMVRTCIS